MKDLEEKILKEFDREFGDMTGEVMSERGEYVYSLKPYIKAFLKKVIKDVREETLREVNQFIKHNPYCSFITTDGDASCDCDSKDLFDKLKGAR